MTEHQPTGGFCSRPDGSLPIVDALPPSIWQVCPPNPQGDPSFTPGVQAVKAAAHAEAACQEAHKDANSMFVVLAAQAGNAEQKDAVNAELRKAPNREELDDFALTSLAVQSTKGAKEAVVACREAEYALRNYLLLERWRLTPPNDNDLRLASQSAIGKMATDAEANAEQAKQEYLTLLAMADTYWGVQQSVVRLLDGEEDDSPIRAIAPMLAALNAAANRATEAVNRTADAINAGAGIPLLGFGGVAILGPEALAIIKGSVTIAGRLSDALLAVASAERIIAQSDGIMSSDDAAAALNIVHQATEAVQDAAKESAVVAALCGDAFAASD